jgi:(E)-4-hydroxy-3-methylbut-2-enyl-diphosphate synthase
MTREVAIGHVRVGGRQPIRIQSMTTTRTADTEATVGQVIRLVDAGCEIVRITAPTVRDAKALGCVRAELVRRGVTVPLVADIHFLPAAAMEAALHVDKVRINPGNYADRKLFRRREYSEDEYESELARVARVFRPLIDRLKERGVALRIGANHGSLSDRIMNRYGDSPPGMVESALEFIRICRASDYHDIVVSMKASNPKVTIQAYRLLVDKMVSESMDYPIHLGVTEAGAGEEGRIKSAVGIGALLDEGIGDTVRVSLTEDPVREIPAARAVVDLCAREPAPEAGRAVERAALPWSRYEYRRRATTPAKIGPVVLGGEAPPAVEIALTRRECADVAGAADTVRRLAVDSAEPVEVVVLRADSEEDLSWAQRVGETLAGIPLGRILSVPAAMLCASPAWADALEVVVREPGDFDAVSAAGQATWVCLDAKATDESGLRHMAMRVARVRPCVVGIAVEGATGRLYQAVGAVVVGLEEAGAGELPLRLAAQSDETGTRAALDAGARLGGLLCDGVGDAVRCDLPDPPADRVRIAYRVLQASGVRITRAEFVSCPSCGRTLFDLEQTTARIRLLTEHLRGVRIAVMGCIVNGPGEMADAHFGYVGAAPQRINLYVGRECVERNIPEAEAPDRLVALIRERGMWHDPEEEPASPSPRQNEDRSAATGPTDPRT